MGRGADAANAARKINGERLTVLGWGRAILMQMAHPLVAAGVAEHSSFTAGRFARLGRLHATVRAMLDLTYGDEQTAAATAARINSIHERVNGRLREDAGKYAAGTRYSATDPRLLVWVHATLLESVPLAYEQFVGPVARGEWDKYCAESVPAARMLHIPDDMLLLDVASLERYMQQMLSGDELCVATAARRVAHDLLYPPLVDPTRPAAWLVRLISIGLLPVGIRDAYGFRWSDGRASALRLLGRLSRGARPFLPSMLALWPEAGRRGGK